MILDQVKADVEVSGDMQTSGFKIKTTAKAFQILSSNIYTRKIEAVIREISCNALDAHTAANNPKPFDVHLPTIIEPFFYVRDYGTGLSKNDVMEIYTTYFCSTKSDSNEYIGALGLGSKSPFAVSESFIVISFYGGEKTVYSCYKDENGEPKVALVSCEPTNEPSGMLIQVQVKPEECSEYTECAYDVYKWFSKLPNINYNIKDEIDSFRSKISYEDNNCFINPDLTANYALMGNVAYLLTAPSIPIKGIVFKFNIGEVSFDPGRERVTNDPKTLKIINEKYKEIIDTVRSDLDLYLSSSDHTPYQKMHKISEAKKSFVGIFSTLSPTASFNSFLQEFKDQKCFMVHRMGYRNRFEKLIMSIRDVTNYDLDNIIWIKHNDASVSQYTYSKICKYLRSLNKKNHCIVVNDQQIKDLVITDLTEIPKQARTNYGNGRTKNTNKYHIVRGDTFSSLQKVDMSALPSGEKIFVKYKSCQCHGYTWPNVNYMSCKLGKNIYAIHYSVFDSKDFDKTGWISLKDYLDRFVKNSPKHIIYTKNFDSKVATYIEKCKDLQNLKYKKLFENFCNLKDKEPKDPEYKLVSHQVFSDEKEKLFKKIVNLLPILKLVHNTLSTKENLEILTPYITKGK